MSKKFLGFILTAALLITSSVSLVYADNQGNGNSKESVVEKKEKSSTSSEKIKEEKNSEIEEAVETVDSDEPVLDEEREKKIEELKEQFKEVHKDKEARKEVLKELVELRRENDNNDIPVFINGNELKSDVAPVIKYGRTLIPVRAVTEALGATVTWNEGTSTATITKTVYKSVYGSTTESTITIELKLDSNIALVNGEEVELDTKAELMSNRTFVPVRFIAETFNNAVDWDEESNSVIIEDDEDDDTDEEADDDNESES